MTARQIEPRLAEPVADARLASETAARAQPLHEMRRIFGPFRGDTANLPLHGDVYPGKAPQCSEERMAASLSRL